MRVLAQARGRPPCAAPPAAASIGDELRCSSRLHLGYDAALPPGPRPPGRRASAPRAGDATLRRRSGSRGLRLRARRARALAERAAAPELVPFGASEFPARIDSVRPAGDDGASASAPARTHYLGVTAFARPEPAALTVDAAGRVLAVRADRRGAGAAPCRLPAAGVPRHGQAPRRRAGALAFARHPGAIPPTTSTLGRGGSGRALPCGRSPAPAPRRRGARPAPPRSPGRSAAPLPAP